MIQATDELFQDFEAVKKIPIVEMMLEVICRTTGMGFAAVARVTASRWLACKVRDEINFGLLPGEELKIETTICNEIRNDLSPVVIDHVDKDLKFSLHHTPKLYGFQSYISFPIIKSNGDFFGTLCAIDPKPVDLKNPKIMGTFKMFAELLSFHLQSIDQMAQTQSKLKEVNHSLAYTMQENRQYQMISMHSLQEPLRKIQLFSDKLIVNGISEPANVLQTAEKIKSFAAQLSRRIEEMSQFSSVHHSPGSLEKVDLNTVVAGIISKNEPELKVKNGTVELLALPVIEAIPAQIREVFYQLISNSIRYSKPNEPLLIKIYSRDHDHASNSIISGADNLFRYVEIVIEDNGVGMTERQLQKLFDVFEHVSTVRTSLEGGSGLSYVRKIIHQHGGAISARSNPGEGTTFTIALPVEKLALADFS